MQWGIEPQSRGAPPDARADDWIEPWVGELWHDLDQRVALASWGLPVAAIDPDALPAPARALLPEWTEYRSELAEEARGKAEAGK